MAEQNPGPAATVGMMSAAADSDAARELEHELGELGIGVDRNPGSHVDAPLVVIVSVAALADAVWQTQAKSWGTRRLIPVVRGVVPDDQMPVELGSLNWIVLADGPDKAAGAILVAVSLDADRYRAAQDVVALAHQWKEAPDLYVVLSMRDIRKYERQLASSPKLDAGSRELVDSFLRASRDQAQDRIPEMISAGAWTTLVVIGAVLAVIGALALHGFLFEQHA